MNASATTWPDPGKNERERCRRIARDCIAFLPDDEDEWMEDQPVSCLNCRRRRWVTGGFVCTKEARHG